MNEPDHEDVAVREVEELQDAVDERVAERDQRVDAAERQCVDGELDERVHAAGAYTSSRRAARHGPGRSTFVSCRL